jgi:hypothetical protein
MNAHDITREFLRQHRRRVRSTLLLWSGALTLGALALTGLERLGWWPGATVWTLATIGAAALLLGAWLVRVRRVTPQRLARELDARWTLRARLESATELEREETTWAAALRDNAGTALAERKLPGALGWRGGQVLLSILVCLLLTEGISFVVKSIGTSSSALAAKSEAKAADDVHASIEWKTPEAEIKATAIEEVPLTALADSTTGFRSASLEMIVNGDRELSQPIDAATLGEGTKPGAHELGPSLYLDELQLKPFDVVSYRLVAELNTPGAKRVVSSPPQFVEIRPPQKDAALRGSGSSTFPAQLYELKARQLQLIKQNAALAQLAAMADSDPSWAPENARVAAEQEKLAARTAEVLAGVKAENPPPLVTGNLGEAETAMKGASKEIAARSNESAAKPQNRALALIIELEKFIQQALSGSGPPASDPIKDEQTFKLPARSETPAGQLEALAARQQAANAAAAAAGATAGADGTAGDGKAAAEQEAIAQNAAALSGNGGYQDDVRNAIDRAGGNARDAARQLKLDDRAAARVPAAAAEQAFNEAVEEQEKTGRATAVAELEQVRRVLNTASRASAGERATQLATVRTTLREAAVEQQRTGSAEAAQELVRLADLIGGAPAAGRRVAPTASAPNSPERAREVAVAAAHSQVQLSPRTVAVSRAVRMLSRAGERLTGAANSAASDTLGNLEIASQEAQWVTGDATTIELAQQLTTQADALQRAGSGEGAKGREAGESAVKLATALEHGRPDDARDRIVRQFNPADVDPLYREAVESYFERLSRDPRRPSPATSR